jgi:hypothetical protein
MGLNRWWQDRGDEIFWMEITDRVDLGADLNAPQLADNGHEYWSYSLIREIKDGDVVFHYHKDDKAIVAWSRASGGAWEDTVRWGARGTVARSARVRPYLRPGWRHGVEDFKQVEPPVTLSNLRSRERDLGAIHEGLVSEHGSPIYFPVNFYPGSLRPAQGYLTKLPETIVAMFPALSAAADEARESDRTARRPGIDMPRRGVEDELGTSYVARTRR